MRASLVFSNQYFMEVTLYRPVPVCLVTLRGSPSLGLLETPRRHHALTKGRGTPGAGSGDCVGPPHPRGAGPCVHRDHTAALCLQSPRCRGHTRSGTFEWAAAACPAE